MVQYLMVKKTLHAAYTNHLSLTKAGIDVAESQQGRCVQPIHTRPHHLHLMTSMLIRQKILTLTVSILCSYTLLL